MIVHHRQHLGCDAVHRAVEHALLTWSTGKRQRWRGPPTDHELHRLRRELNTAQIVFRGEAISNATIRELVARADADALPRFRPRAAGPAFVSI